jgi:hypothetical protein
MFMLAFPEGLSTTLEVEFRILKPILADAASQQRSGYIYKELRTSLEAGVNKVSVPPTLDTIPQDKGSGRSVSIRLLVCSRSLHSTYMNELRTVLNTPEIKSYSMISPV